MTVLLATNYLDEADRLCDRIVIIDHGKVVVEGSPESLKASVGADAISVELEAGGGVLEEALAGRPEVKRTVAGQRHLQVYVQDAASFLPGLIRLADELNLRLASVTYKRPSLDDVFLLHTGHQLSDEEGQE